MTQRLRELFRVRKNFSTMLMVFLCGFFVIFLVIGDLARAEPIAFQVISQKRVVEGESKVSVPILAQTQQLATPKTVAVAPAPLYTGSVVQHSKTASTVNGKPFILKGIYGVAIEDMARFKGYGFNVVQNYQLGQLVPERMTRIKTYLDAAQKNGLMVHLFLSAGGLSPEVVASIKEVVTKFKDHPALYGWYMADEPSIKWVTPAAFHEMYLWIKKTDQNHHPVFNSNWELQNFKDSTDTDMRQLYTGAAATMYSNSPGYFANIEKWNTNFLAILNTQDNTFGLPVAERQMGLNALIFMKGLVPGTPEYDAGVERGRIINANLENPPFSPNKPFPDTVERVRGQLWEAISRGSNGSFWYIASHETVSDSRYTIFHRTPLRNALKATLAEMDVLAPRILNPTVGSTTWQVGTVRYWFRQIGSQATIIAVNESYSPATSTTTFPALKDHTASVSNESRTVSIYGGELTDTFEANEAHVYLVDNAPVATSTQ